MKVLTYNTVEEWLADRPGRITGTKLDAVVTHKGNTVKIGVYQLIADKLGLDDGSIDGRDRGHELEQDAVRLLGEKVGIKFETDLVMWISELDDGMAFSPDGYTKDLTICAEAKCLGSALQIEAVITKQIPYKYRMKFRLQTIQAFIVNPKLKEHYLVFHDPRITAHPLFIIKTVREDIEDDIKLYTDYEVQTLKFVNEWIEKLAF